MSEFTRVPLQDRFETTLAQDLSAGGTSAILSTALSFTSIPGGQTVLIGIDYGNSNYEIREVTNISGTTLTLNSSPLARYSGDSPVSVSHSAGASVIISHTWQVFENIRAAIASKFNSAGGTVSGQFTVNTTTGTVRVPSMTTAQRNALTAANGDVIYNTTAGQFERYEAGSWTNFGSGSTPNAADGTAGKVDIATGVEMGAGTATDGSSGALNVIPVSQTVKTSSGAADENKLPILNSSGKLADGFQNITLANATTLTNGSNADSLHTHNQSFLLPAGEAVNGTSTPQAVYISDGTGGRTSGRFYKSDANDTSNAAHHFIGFVTVNAASIGTNYAVLMAGLVSGFIGLTVGSTYYISDTAGAISTNPSSTCIIPIGRAVSTTQILIEKDIPAIQFASNSQTGVPSGTNNYDTTIYVPRKAKEIEVFYRVRTRDGNSGNNIGDFGKFVFDSAGNVAIRQRIVHAAYNAAATTEWDFFDNYTKLNQNGTGTGSSGDTDLSGYSGGNRSKCTVSVNSSTDNAVVVRFAFATASGTGGDGNDYYYAGIRVIS